LEALMELADLGEYVGVDLWSFHTSDGRSIRRVLDFLLPFANGDKKWEHQQITDLNPQELAPLLLKAAIKFANPDYEKAALKIGASQRDPTALLLQAEFRK
jgi:hypothetical protein